MKKLHLGLGIGVAVVLLGLGFLAYSPYKASSNIEQALAKNDPQALDGIVDDEAIQASYRQRLGEELKQALARNDLSDPLLVLGPAMGEVMVQRRAREYAERPTLLQTIASGTPTLATPGLPLRIEGNPLEGASRGYSGLNRFDITTKGPRPVTIVLHRYGVTQWKVAGIETLPEPAPPVPVAQK